MSQSSYALLTERLMRVARSFFFRLAFCCATLLLFACNSDAGTPQVSKPAHAQDQSAAIPFEGPRIFRNYCASCHGVSGKGDGPVAASLKTKVPQLTNLTKRNGGEFPTGRVRRIIAGDEVPVAHGSREMPVWGPIFHRIEYDQDLGYVRLQNVTEYLKTIQEK
jgi:mono/diheme cytochrome c family protein